MSVIDACGCYLFVGDCFYTKLKKSFIFCIGFREYWSYTQCYENTLYACVRMYRIVFAIL